MTYDEVKNMLDEIGFPTAYMQFPIGAAPALPYTIFYYPSSDNFDADDTVYANVQRLNIELYTSNKSFTAEQAVENILNANHIVWEKSESYLDSEHMYEVLYETEIVING